MLPEEKMYVPEELVQLDDLFERILNGNTDSRFNIRSSTLYYAKEHAAYRDDDFIEGAGIVRFYLRDAAMTIVYSTVPTKECKALFPIRLAFIDCCEIEYTYNPDATSIINF